MKNLPVVKPNMVELRKQHLDSLNLKELTATYHQTKSESWRLLLNGKVYPLWVGFSSELEAAACLAQVLPSHVELIAVEVNYA